MKRILKDYRLHEYTEALFLLTLGIIIQVLDGSPFDVWDRWSLAWETEFPREYFAPLMQSIIKTVLSIIILVRCLTTVLYVLFGLITIYCILKETSPKLMLPWLFISGVKSVLLTFFETLTGVYVCSAFGKIRKPCIEFIISKAVELFFATYLWVCIRSIHKDFERFEENYREEELLTKMVIHRVNIRRRRARSMIDESTLQKTSNLNYFGLKDVPNIIFDMLKTEDELSQDSLLSPGMMLTSVSNMGSFDYLKTSLSLGELGVIDLNSFQVSGLDDNRHLSPTQRAMKFLKLTRDDISRAKERTQAKSFADNYKIPRDILQYLVEVKPSSMLNKIPRQNMVFAANMPELEKVKEHLNMKLKGQRFQGDAFSDSYNFDSQDEPEQFVGIEEGEGDEEEKDEDDDDDGSESVSLTGESENQTTPNLWYMTNTKDQVNRIKFVRPENSRRSRNYERLYHQDFMNSIGSEVFDRANKLVKLTSLSDIYPRLSSHESEPELMQPSTSRNVDSNPQDSSTASKSTKSKKLMFVDNFKSSTTMPLSVIVTNLPVQFDSGIRKCKTLHLREIATSSAEILPLSVSTMDSHMKIYDEESQSIEMEEKISDPSIISELISGKEEKEDKKVSKTFAEVNGSNNTEITFKCSRGTSSDFWCDRRNRLYETKWCYRGHTSRRRFSMLDMDEELPVMRSSRMVDGRPYCYDPGISEQMMFIKELMRRPITDVLKFYHNLREAEAANNGIKRICSTDSVRIKNCFTEPFSRISVVKNNSEERIGTSPTFDRYSRNLPGLEKKSFIDRETQVSFGEDGLTSAEASSTAVDKLKRSNSDFVPQLYNERSGTPGNFSLSGTCEEFQNNQESHPREDGTTEESLKSGHSFSSGLTGMDNTLLPNQSSDASCKMTRKYSRRSKFGKGFFSSDQNQVSTEVVSVTDENSNICSAESDESFSLFYSKTADLASPLLDMRRFIYLDHIHYSYKNVKKKGFDVELNGGLPLLVRDSLTLDPSMNMKKVDTPPDPQTGITRRPMDLTFANKDMYSEQETQSEAVVSHRQSDVEGEITLFQNPELLTDGFQDWGVNTEIEKKWITKLFSEEVPDNFDREFVDTSSMNLHSNKGRVGMLSNPAVILQSNKQQAQLQKCRARNGAGSH